jgi:hypothetical protein
MVHVPSSRRSRGDQVKDRRLDTTGYVGSCYSYFAVFIVFCPRGILVFLVFFFLLSSINRILEGYDPLPLLQLSYAISKLGLVFKNSIFIFN